jgi:hypothetical protein
MSVQHGTKVMVFENLASANYPFQFEQLDKEKSAVNENTLEQFFIKCLENNIVVICNIGLFQKNPRSN